MHFPFQNAVSGDYITVQAADGTLLGTFGKFDGPVPNHGPFTRILIASDVVDDVSRTCSSFRS